MANPTVSLVAPLSGDTLGGTPITITGTNFVGTTGVSVGGIAATKVVAVNSTTITCVTPAGTEGVASVLVTNGSGTNAGNTLFVYEEKNTTPVIDNSSGYAVYTWSSLEKGSVGDFVDTGGWAIASVEWEGTAGSGFTGDIEISNNAGGVRPELPNPDLWNVVTALVATAQGLTTASPLVFAAAARPHVTAGDSSTAMACRLLLVK